MNRDNLLEIADLKVEYKTDEGIVYALNGVNLEIKHGETLGLVGETGAGKTTLAMSVLRLLPKNVGTVREGSIVFDGNDLLHEREDRMLIYRGKRISMIFQDPMTSLNPLMKIGDQIEEILSLHNDDKLTREQMDQKVDQMLEMVGIDPERKNDYPHQFSGGMKQRVVIAISLACEPELLIADEPTTALDVTIQAQVLNMMTDLKERLGTSMILITHDLGIVAETCDKVAVMYAGQIVESGSIFDIFENKDHHPYTQGLFASIPNLYVETERLSPIEGLMPDMSVETKGCWFAPRCKHCNEKCLNEAPPVVDRGNGHLIRCHLQKEEVRTWRN